MALNLFSRLMPPEASFTRLFCEQVRCIEQAAQELRDMVDKRQVSVDAHVASIRAIEMAADAVARKIFIGANRTFNAPIDREDILALAHDLDDVRRPDRGHGEGHPALRDCGIFARNAQDGRCGRRQRGGAEGGDAVPRFDHARPQDDLRAVRADRPDRGARRRIVRRRADAHPRATCAAARSTRSATSIARSSTS